MTTGESGPLSGIRVLDFTQVYMGPCATQLLGDYGADVIKVERQGVGDLARTALEDGDIDDNPIFLAINRNKRSIAIDLRTDTGRQTLRDIVPQIDVVVSNFRAGVMDRMGLGYEELAQINPRLIWASGTGFGERGPYSHKGGQDVLAQAYSGVMWRRESEDTPLSVYPTTLCDYTTGMHLFQGVLLALIDRDRTGTGQRLDVTMYDSMLHMQMQEAFMQLNRGYEVNWASMPLSGVFETTDGAVCMVGAFKPNPLKLISEALELGEDLSARPEFSTPEEQKARRPDLQRRFQQAFSTKSTDYWIGRLEASDILCAPVRKLEEALADEQTAVNGMIVNMHHPLAGDVQCLDAPIHLRATPPRIRLSPPRLGEHGSEILRELGVSNERIAELQAEGVLS